MTTLPADQHIAELFKKMLELKASDMFLTAEFPPAMKIDGKLTPVENRKLSAQDTSDIAQALMNDLQRGQFAATKECNFAISPPGGGRFRVNIFVQQGQVGMVLRTIQTKVPQMAELGLPEILGEVVSAKRGLIIVVGGTGSGKSTTMASMIRHRAETSYGHIITIEDPVEYIHPHRNSIVTQREVGVDTDSWEAALANTLRQAPDVILIGEIRSRETMEHAVAFAETGHLCMATIHANNSNQALDRIINFFPEERRHQLLMDLSLNIRAIISQRLVPKKDSTGRVPAIEILLNTPLISDLIFKGEIHGIKELMKRATGSGMQTFDQCLFNLYRDGLITYEDAMRNADSMNDLRLQIKLHAGDLEGEVKEKPVLGLL